MEYTAKIIREHKAENGFWKYGFLNIKTNEEDYFYSKAKVDYVPELFGKLELLLDNQTQSKFFQFFEQNLEEEEVLAQFEDYVDKGNDRLERNPIIKQIDLTPEFLNELHYAYKYKWKTIAKIYGTSVWTLQRLRKRTKSLKQKRGRKRKIEGYNLALLRVHIKKNNTATQQERVDYFNQKGIRLHRSTISRTLKRIGIARKRTTKRYSEQDLEVVKKFLNESSWIYSSPNCLAVDEFGVHLGKASRVAWSRKGCPAVVKQKGWRGFNYTLILCVRNVENRAVVSYKLIKNVKTKERKNKGTDAIDFYNFLKNIELPTSEKYYLLLDNSRIHSAPDKLKEAGLLSMEELARQKNIVLKYLPKYAPELNPIELCFNTVRHFTENLPTNTEEELKKAIDKIIDMVNEKDLTKYFRHCQEFFSLVKNEQ